MSSGNIASPKLQGWITEAIQKGKVAGQPLCKHVADVMNNNHGKYWHCLSCSQFGISSHISNEIPTADNAAMFDLDGHGWLVFRSAWLV